MPGNGLRVAIVHDYLTQSGGAERVVLALLRAFPGARIVTSLYNPSSTFAEFSQYPIETTWLQYSSFFRRHPRVAAPLLPSAFRGYSVENVDVVICSSSGWAHAISTKAPKIIYCHNPPRWLYQPHDYFARFPKRIRSALYLAMQPLGKFDKKWATAATKYIANSTSVRDRIAQTYGLNADVIHPPPGIVPDDNHTSIPSGEIEPGFLLTVSRARSYKNTSAIIEAVQKLPDERLVVVGGSGETTRVNQADSGRISHLGRVTDDELRWLYKNADALIGVSFEDFGLTPVESFGFGTPVLARRQGGYLDTITEDVNGSFIESSDPEEIQRAVSKFRRTAFDHDEVRRSAQKFSEYSFVQSIRALVDREIGGVGTT